MKFILYLYALVLPAISLAIPAGTKGENGNFKISEKSLKHLGVAFLELASEGPWIVPAEALVKIKLTRGVYRRYEGEMTYVIVKVLQLKDGMMTIQSEDLAAGDEVAISGAKYLRFAETDLNSETVDNCSH